MPAHRVGVWGCGRCSFCITSHQLSPPPHRPSPRHTHSPLSLCNHGDFRAAAKCKFLYDQAKAVLTDGSPASSQPGPDTEVARSSVSDTGSARSQKDAFAKE